jgi:hypothetical protein
MKNVNDSINFSFEGEAWKYSKDSGWHFASLPKAISTNIKNNLSELMRPWGSVKIQASIGDTKWDTSLFFDTKKDCFLLPVKSTIRKKEKISAGDVRKICIQIRHF